MTNGSGCDILVVDHLFVYIDTVYSPHTNPCVWAIGLSLILVRCPYQMGNFSSVWFRRKVTVIANKPTRVL